jgi:uncharacterized membrane protein YhaH (DUF805 family)
MSPDGNEISPMPRSFREWLRLWFTFERAVDRRVYLTSGIALVILKYAGDVALVWFGTGRIWRLTDYFSTVATLASTKLQTAPPALLPALAAWALPFLWIGISMSMRRALDAERSAWWALLFFVPGASWVCMAVLSILPSRTTTKVDWPFTATDASPERLDANKPRAYEHRLPSALLAVAAGAALGLAMLVFSVYGLASYGISLFLGTPFVIGALTAFLFNRRYPASELESQQVVLLTLACVGGVALATAAEGAICILMAAPLGIGIGAMGAALGRRIALRDQGPAMHAMLALLVLPTSAVLDRGHAATDLREVRSSIVIDVPPEVVWRHVITFPPLAEPTDLVFRIGIAYPKRAEIRGEGVGAVRYCVFSTGPFVEPITTWDPGHRLAFDVRTQPPPLQEWSPYADIAPPHLDGYFRSRRGEFRLIALAGGRTRLEGSTWYEMRLEPAAYWVFFGDALISRIHGRVLRHIKAVTESESRVERAPSLTAHIVPTQARSLSQ